MICAMVSFSAAFAFVRSYTSTGAPTSWFTQCIPIWLYNQESLTITQVAVEDDLQRALAEWEGVSCTDLSFAYQGVTTLDLIGFDPSEGALNQNTVSFVQERSNWLTDPLAVALTTVTSCQNETEVCAEGATIDADIEINEAYYVFTASEAEPQERRMDLLSILTHEFGHLIGLDHPPLPEATMYMSSVEGEIKKRDLAPDDEQGVCELFPLGDRRQCLLDSYNIQTGLPVVEEQVVSSDEGGCAHAQPRGIAILFYLLLSSSFIRALRNKYVQSERDYLS